MKNHKQFLTALALFLGFFANATDRIVAYGGSGGAFSTISAAITAASSGDRIIIYPNGVAFSENLTITTSLQLLSAVEGQQWNLTGNITYNPSSAGQSFTVSGGNIAGNITTGINAPTGTRTKVNITGCKLTGGHIDFTANYYDMNIASDSLIGGGYVSMASFGKVVGNYINVGGAYAHGIFVQGDGVATNDTMYIVGNKIQMSTYGSQATYGVYWTSGSQFYHIANNFITNGAQNQNLFYIGASKTSATGINALLNNTLVNGNTNSWTFYVASANSYTYVFNNLLLNNGTGVYAMYIVSSLNSIMSYNHIGTGFTQLFGAATNDGTNVTGSNTTIDNTTGTALTGTAINGGNPDSTYIDLDLTRNDAGTGGGSYKFSNFHPMNNLGAGCRTTFMVAPRRIIVGQTISIKGEGFDK